MRPIQSIREIQMIELEILIQFRKFCEDNKIKYYLIGGTLLGAVRHKGFIPWDDDIDVAVLREDYNKLVKLLNQNRSMGNRKFHACIPGDKGYYSTYIKIINNETIAYERDGSETSIWIDVFPMDFMAETVEERRKVYDVIWKNNYRKRIASQSWKHCKKEHPDHQWLQFLRWGFFHIIGAEHYIQKVISGKLFGKQGINFVGDLVWSADPEKDKYPSKAFEQQVEMEFEKELFMVPKGYKEILTNFYGDYMKLPPENERGGHGVRAYYL